MESDIPDIVNKQEFIKTLDDVVKNISMELIKRINNEESEFVNLHNKLNAPKKSLWKRIINYFKNND